ncbi:SH3 domain-containing protein [Frigidibacter sp. RF13]|uniref:SH3 domain-containing protein n=1 Tax=Frigidibacter sp. RF13 TaxID=2997340 RepID=UPI002271C485|nr:SH3 domain-containing protein [Frigidibacter sp. RF13]MCY1126565.1 SH3 domain-containing protein [Frigidibacter sp. RF13]
MFKKLVISAGIVGLMGSGAAMAMESAATTDLNLRQGPGPQYAIVGVIPAGAAVEVEGCVDAANWCQVTYEGNTGWSFGDYLTTKVGEEPMILTMDRTKTQVKTVVYEENKDAAAAAGGTMGAIADALIAGPAGAAVGMVAGAAAGGESAPDTKVTTYVTENPVDYIYLDGEVVVGAGVPDTVTVYPVPESEYSYAYINGVPVVINNADHSIVYIVR